MTENQAENTTLKTDVDNFLQSLVSIVNQTNTSIGVTLNVGGLIIIGELVSVKSYFEGVAREMISAHADYATKDAFQQSFKQICAQHEPPSAEAANENKQLPVFIHLKNAKIFLASGLAIPTDKGIWWRGHLSAVDGFSLGQYF